MNIVVDNKKGMICNSINHFKLGEMAYINGEIKQIYTINRRDVIFLGQFCISINKFCRANYGGFVRKKNIFIKLI